MDPSCTIGFYCKGLQQFRSLREDAEKVLAPPKQKGVYPFFTFADKSIGETLDTSVDMQLGNFTGNSLQMYHDGMDDFDFRNTPSDDEDFVVVDCKVSNSRPKHHALSSNTNGTLSDTNSIPSNTQSTTTTEVLSSTADEFADVLTDTWEDDTPSRLESEANDILTNGDFETEPDNELDN